MATPAPMFLRKFLRFIAEKKGLESLGGLGGLKSLEGLEGLGGLEVD